MNNLEKIMLEQFDDLPEVIQVYVTKSGWEDKLQAIIKENALNKQESLTLSNSTMIIIMAFRKFDEFRDEMRKKMGLIGINLASAIKDVEDKILMPIKPELDKLWAESDEEGGEVLEN